MPLRYYGGRSTRANPRTHMPRRRQRQRVGALTAILSSASIACPAMVSEQRRSDISTDFPVSSLCLNCVLRAH
jgi:hypothetical protein